MPPVSDPEALATWINEKYYGRICAQINSLGVHNRGRVEAIAQDTFVAIYLGIGGLEDLDLIDRWIGRIVKNKVIDAWREAQSAARRRQWSTKRPTLDTLAIEQLLFEIGGMQALLDAMVDLPDKQREVIELHYRDGFSFQQIADLWTDGGREIARQSVKGLHDRAIRALKSSLVEAE